MSAKRQFAASTKNVSNKGRDILRKYRFGYVVHPSLELRRQVYIASDDGIVNERGKCITARCDQGRLTKVCDDD